MEKQKCRHSLLFGWPTIPRKGSEEGLGDHLWPRTASGLSLVLFIKSSCPTSPLLPLVLTLTLLVSVIIIILIDLSSSLFSSLYLSKSFWVCRLTSIESWAKALAWCHFQAWITKRVMITTIRREQTIKNGKLIPSLSILVLISLQSSWLAAFSSIEQSTLLY